MKNYHNKVFYLYKRQRGICVICGSKMGLTEVLDLHHKCRKHRWRIRKYPLFIDSIINLELAHNGCHITKDGNHISDLQAGKYERFLERHPRICDFVNMDIEYEMGF